MGFNDSSKSGNEPLDKNKKLQAQGELIKARDFIKHYNKPQEVHNPSLSAFTGIAQSDIRMLQHKIERKQDLTHEQMSLKNKLGITESKEEISSLGKFVDNTQQIDGMLIMQDQPVAIKQKYQQRYGEIIQDFGKYVYVPEIGSKSIDGKEPSPQVNDAESGLRFENTIRNLERLKSEYVIELTAPKIKESIEKDLEDLGEELGKKYQQDYQKVVDSFLVHAEKKIPDMMPKLAANKKDLIRPSYEKLERTETESEFKDTARELQNELVKAKFIREVSGDKELQNYQEVKTAIEQGIQKLKDWKMSGSHEKLYHQIENKFLDYAKGTLPKVEAGDEELQLEAQIKFKGTYDELCELKQNVNQQQQFTDLLVDKQRQSIQTSRELQMSEAKSKALENEFKRVIQANYEMRDKYEKRVEVWEDKVGNILENGKKQQQEIGQLKQKNRELIRNPCKALEQKQRTYNEIKEQNSGLRDAMQDTQEKIKKLIVAMTNGKEYLSQRNKGYQALSLNAEECLNKIQSWKDTYSMRTSNLDLFEVKVKADSDGFRDGVVEFEEHLRDFQVKYLKDEQAFKSKLEALAGDDGEITKDMTERADLWPAIQYPGKIDSSNSTLNEYFNQRKKQKGEDGLDVQAYELGKQLLGNFGKDGLIGRLDYLQKLMDQNMERQGEELSNLLNKESGDGKFSGKSKAFEQKKGVTLNDTKKELEEKLRSRWSFPDNSNGKVRISLDKDEDKGGK